MGPGGAVIALVFGTPQLAADIQSL